MQEDGKPDYRLTTRSVCGGFSTFLFPWRPVLQKKQREVLGQTVLKYRIKAGFSQEALAEKADIHPNYVGHIERGECAPTVEILLKIAGALNVRLYKLFLKLN
jgi:DNA-binding XRE family transcriptional regulator